MAKQMAFYFDASACNGCKACVVACKSKNQLPVGINWRRVTEYGGGNWVPDPTDATRMLPSNIFAYAVSLACNHCQDPICMESCPTNAISKDENGVVKIDQNSVHRLPLLRMGVPVWCAAVRRRSRCHDQMQLLRGLAGSERSALLCRGLCDARAGLRRTQRSASQVWHGRCHRTAARRRPYQTRVGHYAASSFSDERRGNRPDHRKRRGGLT